MKLFSKQSAEGIQKKFWRFNLPPLLIVALLALVYMLFATGKIIWNNLQFDKQLKEIKTQISKLEDSNTTLAEQILYLQTDSFKEREARTKLGLVKPGEKVLVVPPAQKSIELPKPVEAPKEKDNWQKWLEYFFKTS